MSAYSEVDEPSWPDILRAVQEQLANRIHTSMPGVIKSYDSTTQRATVQPAVQLGGVTLPILADVPVIWPGGSSGFLHVPLASGDTCMLLFAEEDFSGWDASGSVSAPAVLQRHGLHAVAIPGLRSTKAPFGATSGHTTLSVASELRLGSDTASNFVALANLVDDRLGKLQAAFDAHTHLTAGTGAPVPPTAVPGVIPVGALATVAASKVKAS